MRDARKAGNVIGAVAEAEQNTGPSFETNEFFVIASELTPKGPIYRRLGQIVLAGPALGPVSDE